MKQCGEWEGIYKYVMSLARGSRTRETFPFPCKCISCNTYACCVHLFICKYYFEKLQNKMHVKKKVFYVTCTENKVALNLMETFWGWEKKNDTLIVQMSLVYK